VSFKRKVLEQWV